MSTLPTPGPLIKVKAACFPYSFKFIERSTVGGWTSVDQNDETVRQLAQFAARQICSNHIVDAIEKAETQVVAGINYRMDILVSKAWKCKVEVFEQTWTNTQRLTPFACKSVP
ncbi:hypothetical protein DPMN_089086 [Dreissena polymorpha]|uniref:Cystatin domain-containing protein n=1 Tax=Dreissena polymorpha TaxID=45954 RepID=A0A9D4QX39_DREPO|nr:hypothetical protein DPMN_089086 [Dreissena polymorpha]